MNLEEYFKRYADATPKLTTTQRCIADVCDEIKEMLIQKNRGYGDSFLDPVGVFSKCDPVEQLNVRIDDKLKRIKCGDPNAVVEDTEIDLIGYLILKQVLRRMA